MSYLFFRAMEVEVSALLKAYIVGGTVPEAEVVSSVCSHEDVLSYWNVLTGAFSIDKQSALLKELVQLWLTIRVHSFTRTVLVEYKHEKQVTTAIAMALGATLKEDHHPETD